MPKKIVIINNRHGRRLPTITLSTQPGTLLRPTRSINAQQMTIINHPLLHILHYFPIHMLKELLLLMQKLLQLPRIELLPRLSRLSQQLQLSPYALFEDLKAVLAELVVEL